MRCKHELKRVIVLCFDYVVYADWFGIFLLLFFVIEFEDHLVPDFAVEQVEHAVFGDEHLLGLLVPNITQNNLHQAKLAHLPIQEFHRVLVLHVQLPQLESELVEIGRVLTNRRHIVFQGPPRIIIVQIDLRLHVDVVLAHRVFFFLLCEFEKVSHLLHQFRKSFIFE